METKAALDRLSRLWRIPECIGVLSSCVLSVLTIGGIVDPTVDPIFVSYLSGTALIAGLTLTTLAVASPLRRTSVKNRRFPSFGDVLISWVIALGLALLLGMVGGFIFALFQERIMGQYIDSYEWGYFVAGCAMIMIAADIVALAVGTLLVIVSRPRLTRHVP